MSSRPSKLWAWVAAFVLLNARALGHDGGPVPANVILVKGAWSSSTGTARPVPEGGAVSNGRYDNAYFGLDYALVSGWTQKYEGPPPSDSGRYVLAQLEPQRPAGGDGGSHVMIAAQDLFFTLTPAHDAAELVRYYQENLGPEYRVKRMPSKIRIAQRDFVRLDYAAPAAGLEWHVLATDIRCHVVLFTFTGPDAGIVHRLIESMNSMPGPPGGTPVCIKDYVNAATVTEREDPILAQARFNPVPVRIVIDAQGRVEHVHFLSAFPDQAKSIADALLQWRFKPFYVNGQPVEVETGLMFGRPPHPSASAQR